jgi:hypothetical protein
MRGGPAFPGLKRPWALRGGPAFPGLKRPWAQRGRPAFRDQKRPWACGPARKRRGSFRPGPERPSAGARAERSSGSLAEPRLVARRCGSALAWAAAPVREVRWATGRVPRHRLGGALARKRSMSWQQGLDLALRRCPASPAHRRAVVCSGAPFLRGYCLRGYCSKDHRPTALHPAPCGQVVACRQAPTDASACSVSPQPS